MSRTDLPPTFKQLRYLRTLAGRAGQTFATPRTRQPRSVGSSVSARLGSPSRSCRRSRPLAPISPEDQFLTLRCVVRTVSIIDSAGFVDSSVRLSLPLIPSRITVSVSSMPSVSEQAAPGCVCPSSSASRLSCSSARG